MRVAGRDAMLPTVGVQLVMEIERSGPTVCGQIAVGGAPATGFFGWLELIDHLERAAASCGASVDNRAAMATERKRVVRG